MTFASHACSSYLLSTAMVPAPTTLPSAAPILYYMLFDHPYPTKTSLTAASRALPPHHEHFANDVCFARLLPYLFATVILAPTTRLSAASIFYSTTRYLINHSYFTSTSSTAAPQALVNDVRNTCLSLLPSLFAAVIPAPTTCPSAAPVLSYMSLDYPYFTRSLLTAASRAFC